MFTYGISGMCVQHFTSRSSTGQVRLVGQLASRSVRTSSISISYYYIPTILVKIIFRLTLSSLLYSPPQLVDLSMLQEVVLETFLMSILIWYSTILFYNLDRMKTGFTECRFKFREQKKSHRATSGEYGGGSMVFVVFFSCNGSKLRLYAMAYYRRGEFMNCYSIIPDFFKYFLKKIFQYDQ